LQSVAVCCSSKGAAAAAAAFLREVMGLVRVE